MNKMTVQEKVGHLNLVTPGGGIPTGAVVSTGVEEKIQSGKVGGIFGVYGPQRVRQAQRLAVEESRPGIPLLFGSDVIHGYKPTFPLPVALSCTWDTALIEPLADSQNNMPGTSWAPTGDLSLAVLILQGLKDAAGKEVNILLPILKRFQ